MRAVPYRRVLALAAMLAWAAFAAPAAVVTTDELFKWGEYESLIRALEPLLDAPGPGPGATRADSAERARSLVYLGVAYSAKGRTDRAEPAFRLACALDPEAEMDKFYVTPAIAAHFDAIKAEDLRGRRERAASAAGARPAPSAAEALPSRKAAERAAVKEARSWVWWGVGTAAAVVAGGGMYWYASQSSGPRESVTTVDVR